MRTIAELSSLSGRVALVTGGAGHIGRAIAAGLAEQGAQVVVADRSLDDCLAVAVTLPGGVALACDLASEDSARQLVRTVVAQCGGLDIFVHCAAFVGTTQLKGWAVPFAEQSVAAWDAAVRVNLTAPFVIIQEGATALAKSGHGAVVLIDSIYGMVGPDTSLYAGTAMANPAGYGASKGGLLQLMRYLATTLAPRVRVNAVSPGGVLRGQPEVFRLRYEARTPLGRMATEEDMKGAVCYLASDLSRYVTGHNLVVDGGWTAW